MNSAAEFVGEGLNEVRAVERPSTTNFDVVTGSGASEGDEGLRTRGNDNGGEGLTVAASSTTAKSTRRLADTDNLRANRRVVVANGERLGWVLRVRVIDFTLGVTVGSRGDLAREGDSASTSTFTETELIANEGETVVSSGTDLIITTEVVIAISDIALTATVVVEDKLIRRRHVRRLTNGVSGQRAESINAPAVGVLRI